MTKVDREIMEILEAFDLTRSANLAAELAGTDPKMVSRYVALRDKGTRRAQGITAISSLTSHCGWQSSEGSCGGFETEVDGR